MSRYLIFGGTGSLGKKLIDRLISSHDVHVYSRDEAKHWTIKNELSHKYENVKNVTFHVGDIRDYNRVKDVIRQVNPTHIIIAAALKQVDTCECSPNEAIATNITGTQNVIAAVKDLGPNPDLYAVLFVSTDKACSPVNVYGMCKSISERLVSSQVVQSINETRYLVVRYGNVLESRGSIIPLFKYQAETQEFLTVTDPNMTRFVMTLDQSVDLIMMAFNFGKNGQTWIPDLKSMRIGDLAEIFAERHKKDIKTVGLRPGEKKHEDLINESESCRTYMQASNKRGLCYIIENSINSKLDPRLMLHAPIGPDNLLTYAPPEQFKYSSEQNVMTKSELLEHLTKLKIIDMKSDDFQGKSIEEIRK